ncbi:MAG: hypothetical protein ACE366_30900 [Bradymonadia bacterium]
MGDPTIVFTIGYLHSRALWQSIGQLSACLSNDAAEGNLRQELGKGASTWLPDQCIDAIAVLSNRLRWQWTGYQDILREAIGAQGLLRGFAEIDAQGPDERTEGVRKLIQSIAEHSGELFRQVKVVNPSNTDIKMLFVGQQVGKIDQILREGERHGAIEGVMPACQEALATLFVEISHQDLQDVLGEFRQVKSSVGKVAQPAMRAFVSQMKDAFLWDVERSAATTM